MLIFFTGTERQKTRAALNAAAEKAAGKNGEIIRITDANPLDDLRAALGGSSLFGGKRIVVFDGILANEEMCAIFLRALPMLAESPDTIFLYEEKPDAQTRKAVEKYAGKSERFDMKKEKERGGIFSLAYALRRGDKKQLWVEYQRALARDEEPEAIHGVLFWGAKQAMLAARGAKDTERTGKLVAELAELPHEARRNGLELEYALERYILSLSASKTGVNK